MSFRGRGSTGPGRPARLPEAGFQAPPPVRCTSTAELVIDFHGDDGRQMTFDLGGLPMPSWHGLLAEAFSLRVGPAGGLRTLASAVNSWDCVLRWLRWLERTGPPALAPADLTRAHVVAFSERATASEHTRYTDMLEFRTLMRPRTIRDQLPEDAWSAFRRRLRRPHRESVGGYSDGEWTRLLAAARADTAATAQRIRASEELLRRFTTDPASLTRQERTHAAVLAKITATGEVPAGDSNGNVGARTQLASQLFLVWKDMVPLLVLLVAVTERNGETVKELPAAHRILEGRAVELVLTKRRRGIKRWFETVTWEIGPPGRELYTAGGLYLLLLELTSRSRAVCGSSAAFCLWSSGHRTGSYGNGEHVAPFEIDLRAQRNWTLNHWAATRTKPVFADAEATVRTDGSAPAQARPLHITLNRVRTSAEVRRTRSMGGHLPSAAKSNTAQVLYGSYLRPDPTIREWAEQVLGEALVDAEQAARRAHEQAALNAHEARSQARGGGPTVSPDPVSLRSAPDGGLPVQTALGPAGSVMDTAWAVCTDHDHHPATGRECRDSFLACFHCGNCLITRDKLPRLLALLDALHTRLQQMEESAWWKLYGPTWAAIRRDILPKFNPAEVAEARQGPMPDALLDLVEAPWEQP